MPKVDMKKLRRRMEERRKARKDAQSRLKGLPRYEKILNKKKKLVDIVIGFGVWEHCRVSEMLDDPEGQNYICNFILGVGDFHEDFKKDIIKVCKHNGYEVEEGEEDIPY